MKNHETMRAGAAIQISELERQIADLKARLPKHSIPPAMLIELEELEETLERARMEAAQENTP
jgi:hypothetical protein